MTLLIKPLHDWLQVKPSEVETTKTGLFLASSKTKPTQATVLAIGPGKRTAKGELIPLGVEVGQTVLFSEGALLEQVYRVNNEDVKCFFVQAEHVIGAL